MTKVVKCRRKISAFGGLNFVINLLEKRKLPSLFDQHLGVRVKQAKYSYSEIVLSWIYANLCGAERLEDIMSIKDQLEHRPGFQCPSSDRISDMLRRFTTNPEVFVNQKTNTKNEFNINLSLNRMMIDSALKMKEVKKSVPYTLDYDNVLIFNNKYDSKVTYKMEKGYSPGVMFIGHTPVYIENRNGNSHAATLLDETLERGFNLLKEQNIKIDKFRSDSGAYSYKVFNLMDELGIKFYIRARRMNEELLVESKINRDWKTFKYNDVEYEATSVMHGYRGTSREYRYVVYRFKSPKLVDGKEDYSYRSIITSDMEMSDEQVVKFYNYRGAIERNFDDLKNNFNWSRLPFSFLNENTVFLIISAIASIMYRFCLKEFSKSIKFVKKNWRLKNFRFHFINIPAWWEDDVLFIDTEKDYGG